MVDSSFGWAFRTSNASASAPPPAVRDGHFHSVEPCRRETRRDRQDLVHRTSCAFAVSKAQKRRSQKHQRINRFPARYGQPSLGDCAGGLILPLFQRFPPAGIQNVADAFHQVPSRQDAGDGLQFFGRNSQDGSPRCGFDTHGVVRLAVVPLSGGIAGFVMRWIARGACRWMKSLWCRCGWTAAVCRDAYSGNSSTSICLRTGRGESSAWSR
jgi:hypothetical protein